MSSAKWWRVVNHKLDVEYLVKGLKPFCESPLGKTLELSYGAIMSAQSVRLYRGFGSARGVGYNPFSDLKGWWIQWRDWHIKELTERQMEGMDELKLGTFLVFDVKNIRQTLKNKNKNSIKPLKPEKMKKARLLVHPKIKKFWGKDWKTFNQFEDI